MCAHPAVVVVVGGADSAALQVRGELVVNVARLNGQGGEPKEGHSLVSCGVRDIHGEFQT